MLRMILTPRQGKQDLDLGVCPEDQDNRDCDGDSLGQHQKEGHKEKVLQEYSNGCTQNLQNRED